MVAPRLPKLRAASIGIQIGFGAAVAGAVALDLRPRKHATLLYDGDCQFCQRFVRWAQARDARVTFVPCAEATDVRKQFGLTAEDCADASWLNDGSKLHRGAAAINEVLRRLPGWANLRWRFVALLMRPQPVLDAEQCVYQWVAKHRSAIEQEIQILEAA